MTRCDRCGIDTTVSTMSFFNTQVICMRCARLEREHALYPAAVAAEQAACRAGNYNYQGIGLPDDLRPPKED